MKQIFKKIIKTVQAWWKRVWFESKLKARLKIIELENQIEAEQELQEHFKPLYSEKPIDAKLQTGESANLGGEMRLSARWNVSSDETDKSN